MPAQRRDAEGNRQVAPTWESLVERQIREAMAEGAFEGLPHQGAPLPPDELAAAGDRAMAYRVLRNSGVAPPWIEADKEVRALLATRDALLERAPHTGPLSRQQALAELDRIVAAANRAIGRLNAEAPTDRQRRRPLDPEAERSRLEAAFG